MAPTSKKGLRLTHLFFADDSLLFCKANLQHWRRLSRVSCIYERELGQRLNQEKSQYFSCNTTEERKQEILRVARIPLMQRYDKYLGLLALWASLELRHSKV
jgi:hypothetical protein